MPPFRKILVDIDAMASAHPALDRAVLIAKRTGAALTVGDVVTIPSYAEQHLPPGIEEKLILERRQQLDRIAAGVSEIRTDVKLLSGRPATALIQEVLKSGHDLVMRSHARDTARSGVTSFGAVDMDLLRRCPCPVLLVRQGKPALPPRIACAVDASSDEREDWALNRKIVNMGLSLAAALDSESPVLLHAWAPFAERAVRLHGTESQLTAYVDKARERARSHLSRLARSVDVPLEDDKTVLHRGEPDDVIPQFIVSENIDLLVMGTVGRAGLAGMFIGNTAERVLRKLPCSVLAVKPDSFVSPVSVKQLLA